MSLRGHYTSRGRDGNVTAYAARMPLSAPSTSVAARAVRKAVLVLRQKSYTRERSTGRPARDTRFSILTRLVDTACPNFIHCDLRYASEDF